MNCVWAVTLLVLVVCLPLHHALNVHVLHTADVRAHVEQMNKYGGRCTGAEAQANKCFGGAARRVTAVDDVRRAAGTEPVLLLDSGDQFQGILWYLQGYESSFVMNSLNYTAMALGNHELDNGVSGLVPFLDNVTFPVLSANLDISREPRLAGKIGKSTILDIQGIKIGLVGVTTNNVKFEVDPKGIVNLSVKDTTVSVRQEVTRLQAAGVNKIIVLASQDYAKNQQLAKDVAGIDVIVGGDSDTLLYNGAAPSVEVPAGGYPRVIKNATGSPTLIVHAGAYGKYLGHLSVTFNGVGDITTWSGNPILLDKSVKRDAAMMAELSVLRKRISPLIYANLGETQVLLEGGKPACRVGECNLGDIVTDALLKHVVTSKNYSTTGGSGWSQAAIAIYNGGGIRTSIARGMVLVGDVLKAFPFDNNVEVINITGQILLDALEFSVKNYSALDPKGRFLQLSGVRVEYALAQPEGQRVRTVHVRCSACPTPKYVQLDPSQVYSVVMNTFLVHGGDGYSMFKQYQPRTYGNLTWEVVRSYLETQVPIIQGTERRITFYTPPPPVLRASSLSQADAETVMFVLIAVCFAMILALVMLGGNYIELNKKVTKMEKEKRQPY